ncbi:hypothetical protein [Streptomyces candidus]|uniref:Lipoprotein n=1 Tax=Streptomyces candidus TaxID=67283 RepID=A0A7X0HAG7_9ACTN|nr:hypothetical protein [Streptomyces candidus]MBB6434080.1 hypothetical protein [Streptomyces candidus]GHH33403.1 hypothetical protein GCM10018773_03900 [Streptomyces candidus]
MGATGRIRHRRTLAALGVAGAMVAGVTACEPGGGGGLGSFAVALTTDRTGTAALERAGVDVAWLSCTSTVGERGRVSTGPDPGPRPSVVTPRPGAREVATVVCEGQTGNGREIRINGKVTDERDGRCVRGDLTAKVADRTVFRVSVLGDCDARTVGPTSRPTQRPPQPTREPPPQPTPSPQPTRDPAPSRDPAPTVTVTVTADPRPDPPPHPAPTRDPEPTCSCPPEK